MRRIEQRPPLPTRPLDGHKGQFGRVLVIAGSRGMAGAAALAGKAALRSGAGLVRIACPEGILDTVASFEPAYTTLPLAQDDRGRISDQAKSTLFDQVAANDVVALGPGLGQSGALRSIIALLIALPNTTLVLDADGLNNLSKIRGWPRQRRADLIMTPHPGEMGRLWPSVCREPMPTDRCALAERFVALAETTLILKGAGSVVASRDGLYVNTTGNPGMATGGSGDVLTGIVAALAGQGLTSLDAAILATYVHGRAGDIAASRLGQVSLSASDIIDALPEAFQSL